MKISALKAMFAVEYRHKDGGRRGRFFHDEGAALEFLDECVDAAPKFWRSEVNFEEVL